MSSCPGMKTNTSPETRHVLLVLMWNNKEIQKSKTTKLSKAYTSTETKHTLLKHFFIFNRLQQNPTMVRNNTTPETKHILLLLKWNNLLLLLFKKLRVRKIIILKFTMKNDVHMHQYWTTGTKEMSSTHISPICFHSFNHPNGCSITFMFRWPAMSDSAQNQQIRKHKFSINMHIHQMQKLKARSNAQTGTADAL